MSKFVFDEDFAGNWVKGQTVPCEQVDGDYLVDGVAKISAGELMKHGHFEDEQSQATFTDEAALEEVILNETRLVEHLYDKQLPKDANYHKNIVKLLTELKQRREDKNSLEPTFTKDGLKAQALNLWQQLNEAELPYEDFVEVQEHIINLFASIN